MPRLVRDRATWLIYAQLGVWGYFLYGFGPVVPMLRVEQRVSATAASLHGTALAVGGVLGGLLLPALVRRLGRGGTLWLAMVGVAVTGIALCLAHPLPGTLAATVAVSTFGTILVGSVVAALAAHHGLAGPAAISEANAIACGMGVLAPLVIGFAVAAGFGWRPGLAAVAGLVALVAVIAFSLGVRVPRGAVPSTVDVVGPLPRAYWIAWTLMATTGAVEVSLSLWAADVLRGHAGTTAGGAAAAVSAIVAGMAVGRLLGGRLVLRLGPVRLFLGALGLSAVGFAVFWTATSTWLAVAGLMIVGLGNSMHYPLGISLALRTAPGQEDRAAGWASYSMALGFGLGPFILGAIADGVGTHLAFLVVPVLLALAAILVARLARRLAVPVPVPA